MRMHFACTAVILGLAFVHPASADQACANQCWAEYDSCPCGDYWSCSICDERRDSCLANCDSCPRVWRDYTTTQTTDTAGPLPLVCLSDRKMYRRWFRATTKTHYQEILNCDWTLTTTVVGVQTTTKNCWKVYDPQANCTPDPHQAPIGVQCIL